MRSILIVALTTTGFALSAASPTSAAPVNGSAIGNAAQLNQLVDQAHWRWRRHHRHHRHCWWRHGRLHCVWW